MTHRPPRRISPECCGAERGGAAQPRTCREGPAQGRVALLAPLPPGSPHPRPAPAARPHLGAEPERRSSGELGARRWASGAAAGECGAERGWGSERGERLCAGCPSDPRRIGAAPAERVRGRCGTGRAGGPPGSGAPRAVAAITARSWGSRLAERAGIARRCSPRGSA